MSEILTVALPDSLVERIVDRATEEVLARLDVADAKSSSPYLTVAEAADYLRCKSRQRVYDLLSAARLTRYKDGSRVLVSRAEIDAYLAGSRPPCVAPSLPHADQTRMNRRLYIV